MAGFAPVSGLSLGVLMLETRFPRLPGDIGNATTWPFPVQYRVVRGATPARVVEQADPALLEPFIEAGRELAALGVAGITTSCGFLALFQKELAAALPVPVMTSSLLQVPMVEAMLPAGKRAGILTYSGESLTARHLAAVGVAADTPVQGMPRGGAFFNHYNGSPRLSTKEVLEQEVVAAARDLVARHPEVGAIVCECTNLPPHSRAIAEATGLAVHDVISMGRWFVAGLRPPAWG